MDLRYSPAAEEFRREIRSWLDVSVPAAWRHPTFWLDIEHSDDSFTLRRAWEKERFTQGFAGVDWPTEYGGRGGNHELRAVHDEEMMRANAPSGAFLGITYLGTSLLGPALLRFGTEEQKRRILPGILSGETIWGQGFSEPETGSDLASLRTSARREGDEFVVSGQKIWTSLARFADAMFCLVRTDPDAPKREGITFLLMDLGLPGTEVRPIRQMSGSNEFGEEFFDNVHVPIKGNVVGDINDGWNVAKYLLSVERNASPMSHYVEFTQELNEVMAAARTLLKDGKPAIEIPSIREKIARCKADLELLRIRAYYTMSRLSSGKDLGTEASITKLLWSKTRLAIADLGADVIGIDGQRSFDPSGMSVSHLRWRHFQVRGQRIAGGTAQVQRTLIAHDLMGLPR